MSPREAQTSPRPSNPPKRFLEGQRSFLKTGGNRAEPGGPGETAHLHPLCSRAGSARGAGEPIPGLKALVGVASSWPRPSSASRGAPRAGRGKRQERAGSVRGGCARARARAPGGWAVARPCARTGEAAPAAVVGFAWRAGESPESGNARRPPARPPRPDRAGFAGPLAAHPGRPGRGAGRVRARRSGRGGVGPRLPPLPAPGRVGEAWVGRPPAPGRVGRGEAKLSGSSPRGPRAVHGAGRCRRRGRRRPTPCWGL